MDSFWAAAIIPNADIRGISGKGCGVEWSCVLGEDDTAVSCFSERM